MEGLREDTWQDTYDDRYDEAICPKCKTLNVHAKNTSGSIIYVKCSSCGEAIPVESDPEATNK